MIPLRVRRGEFRPSNQVREARLDYDGLGKVKCNLIYGVRKSQKGPEKQSKIKLSHGI